MAVWLSKIGENQPHPFDAATSRALESLFCSGSGDPVNLPAFGLAVTNDDLDVMHKNPISLVRQKPSAELRDELVYYWDDLDWVPYDRKNSTLVLDAKAAGRSKTAIYAAATNTSSTAFNTVPIKPTCPRHSGGRCPFRRLTRRIRSTTFSS